MIDLGGEGSFLRFWLPLLLLGGVITLLFPQCGPREDRLARETWDGLVVLASFDPPPEKPMELLATLPIGRRVTSASQDDSSSDYEDRWIIGQTHVALGIGSQPILLITPRGSALSNRLARRIDQDASNPQDTTTTLHLFSLDALGDAAESRLIGSILRVWRGDDDHPQRWELVSQKNRWSIQPPEFERTDTIRLDRILHRRWMGNPSTFDLDWNRFREEDPGGGLPRFIHARLTLRTSTER